MNLLPKHGTEFASKDYWTDFFDKRKDPFEWYGTYWELSFVMQKYVKSSDEILMVGCGNSELSEELYSKQNCKLITNIDISENVISRMKKKAEQNQMNMIFEVGDVTKMKYSDEKFNTVIDKGTLDAMMVDTESGTVEMINSMFAEIERCIKNNGRYIIITLAQKHISKHLNEYFAQREGWLIRLHEHIPEQKEGHSVPLPVFIFVLTRMRPIKPGLPAMKILEIYNQDDDKCNRVGSSQEIVSFIKSKQEWSQMKGFIQKIKPSDEEVNFQLFSPEVDGVPRFNLHIVDSISNKNEMGFFIVSSGREFDWLYSTKEGRKSLSAACKQAVPGGFQRLVVVLLNMLHKYESMEAVKTELSWLVNELKAATFKERIKVPFLTESNEIENRDILGRGTSKLSGNYVIEQSSSRGRDNEEHTYRRLIFESTPTLIQSECRMVERKIKTKKGKKTKNFCIEFDYDFVASEYYYGIILATEVVLTSKTNPKVLIVGLGGGCVTSYLGHKYPNLQLDSVEIDEEIVAVAKKYFYYKESEKVKAIVGDGIKIIESSEAGSVDLLVLDVDQKDPALPLRCPPQSFIEEKSLQNSKRLLSENGIMVVNLVCRDAKLRSEIVRSASSIFKYCLVLDCGEDINKILLLAESDIQKTVFSCGQNLRSRFDPESADNINFMLSKMKLS